MLPDAINFVRESNKETAVVYSLAFDEIHIRRQIIFRNGRFTGFVDYGGLSNENKTGVEATAALFCVATEVNGNKTFPIAYILTSGLSAILLHNFIDHCIGAVEAETATVLSVTFDGLRANFKAAESLGAVLDITSDEFAPFFASSYSKKSIYVYPDPLHMYKLLRNCFSQAFVFFDENGNVSFH